MEKCIKLEIIKILGILSLLEEDKNKTQNDLINIARASAVNILNLTKIKTSN